MKRKWIAICLIVMLAVTMTACGGAGKEPAAEEDKPSVTQPETGEPEEVRVPEKPEGSDEEKEPEEEPAQEPEQPAQQPAQQPEQKPDPGQYTPAKPAPGKQDAEETKPGHGEDPAQEEDQEEPVDEDKNDSLTAAECAALKTTTGKLAWNLYGRLDLSENFVFSPYSITGMLLLADAGADGETQKEIEAALGVKSRKEILQAYRSYLAKKTGVKTGNAIWLDKTYLKKATIRKEYISTAKRYMNGTAEILDFKGNLKGAKTRIREWVSQATGGIMNDYESIADQDTAVDLMNAVGFEAEWRVPFDGFATRKDTFYGLHGKAKTPMMNQSGVQYRYYEADGMKGIELQYKKGSVVMDIITTDSKKDTGIAKKWAAYGGKDAFLAGLDKAPMTQFASVLIPKFENDYDVPKMKNMLQKLGIRSAFAPGADFSGICGDTPGGLYISDVAHRAMIKVDEKGTKAAAVTEGAMKAGSAFMQEPVTFEADHPFLYMLRDRKTGVVLFVGLYNDPA